MTFLAPTRLWLFVAVAALAGAYVVLQLRRRGYAARFTNVDLLASIAPRRPGWRRHLAALGVILGLSALIIGLARPARDERVPSEEAIVMLVVDVSASMEATDVAPSRIEAARSAAQSFVEGIPDDFQVGLVAFDASTRVLATPSADHESVISAIERLETGPGTAAGDALAAALDTVAASLNRASVEPTTDEGEHPAATIVLVSDGVTTVGRPLEEATSQAVEQGVPVTTIAYGTDAGTVMVEGEIVNVPADPEAMSQVADQTGGSFFTAESGSELENVYDDIQTRVGFHLEQREILRFFIGLGVLALVLAAAASMLWSARFL
jgi:Ca-activated chloride channel family protein